MKLEEYLKYFNFIQGADSYKILIGDSLEELSIARAKAVVAFARIGYAQSKAASWIRDEFLKIRNDGSSSIDEAKKTADKNYEQAHEVGYSDLSTLLESVNQFINGCAARQRALDTEFRGTQRGEL